MQETELSEEDYFVVVFVKRHLHVSSFNRKKLHTVKHK